MTIEVQSACNNFDSTDGEYKEYNLVVLFIGTMCALITDEVSDQMCEKAEMSSINYISTSMP